MKKITVFFYQNQAGKEPVKDWLIALPVQDRKVIGQEVKTVEFGWPLGMPLVRKMEKDLWEVRVDLEDGRIGRVLFTVAGRKMILLHGFVKKSQKTPKPDLAIARKRKNEVLNNG
jgi:phage-related protein|tara:strand:+ start:1785 stop:2129 length:345 start_codon:yes stop_codon:yes gene_type:complete